VPRIRTTTAYKRLVEAVPDAVIEAIDLPLTTVKARREHARDTRNEAARKAKASKFEWWTARTPDPHLTGSFSDVQ
jgi:hypothetical protein